MGIRGFRVGREGERRLDQWGDLLERLLPGVCAYVIIECCCPGERSATISTFKRSVAGVRHHVIPQIRRLREGLGTMATLVGSKREGEGESATGEEKSG